MNQRTVMLALKTLLTSRNDNQDPQSRAGALNEAFAHVRIEASKASLYGAFMEEIISQILRQYIRSAKKNIRNGTVYELWTKTKISHLKEIVKIIEKINRQSIKGDEIKEALLSDIETQFLQEFLPAKRKEFSDRNGNWTPEEGTLEKQYIPAIMKSIMIVHQIFKLFQIENRSRSDFRLGGEGSDEAVALLHTAHDMAKEMSVQLLDDYSKTTLNSAQEQLREIQSECDQIIEDSVASKGVNQQVVVAQGMDVKQLYCVYKTFVRKINEIEASSLEVATHNPVTLTKKAVNGTIEAACSAASALGNTSHYLTNQMINLYMGKTQGSSNRNDDSDDEDDDALMFEPSAIASTNKPVRYSPPNRSASVEHSPSLPYGDSHEKNNQSRI
jgi:hypothetical protein